MFVEELMPRVRAVTERACAAQGLELAWLDLVKQRGSVILRVFIDRAGSESDPSLAVGLDDCERVTERLSVLLDVEDPIDSPYTLEVSTPGLDRPLHGEADFRRFHGKMAIVKTTQDLNGRRQFVGRLRGVDEDFLLFESVSAPAKGKRRSGREQEVIRIPLDSIETARLEVELPGSGAKHSFEARLASGGSS